MAQILAVLTIVVLSVAMCKFLCGRVEKVLNQIDAVSFGDWWLRANLSQRIKLGLLSYFLISAYQAMAYTIIVVLKSFFSPTTLLTMHTELSGWTIFIIIAGSISLHLVMLRNFFRYIPTENDDPTIEEMTSKEKRYWKKTLTKDKKMLETIIKDAQKNLDNINNDLDALKGNKK